MIATAPASVSVSPVKTRQRKAWAPDANDHLIYRWVKFEGRTQGWVAAELGIHQTTVSRVIQRYERWQAHAQPGDDGRLDHAERLRAQRWLTYERNELILASALRIAGELEGFTDVSKSTLQRPAGDPSRETEIRTQHATIDRSGTAARFLRLAFRINMEQLKLAEMEPLMPLGPLEEEWDEGESGGGGEREREGCAGDAEAGVAGVDAGAAGVGAGVNRRDHAALPLNVHILHSAEEADCAVSADVAGGCDCEGGSEKNSLGCMHRSRVGAGATPREPLTGGKGALTIQDSSSPRAAACPA